VFYSWQVHLGPWSPSFFDGRRAFSLYVDQLDGATRPALKTGNPVTVRLATNTSHSTANDLTP
jgi:hypothetical protein